MGSSLMNLLILAILDLTQHSRGRMLSTQSAAHSLSGSMSAALTCLIAIGLLTGKRAGAFAVLGISPAIYALVAAYLFGVRLVYMDQQMAHQAGIDAGAKSHEAGAGMTLWKAVAGFAACAAVILVAGPFLAHAADALAEKTGLGGTFVGTTLVAFSTSLPELVSSLAALKMGAHDLAIGNVFGSNSFNMILLAPLDVVHPGPLLAAVSPSHAITCVATVLATQIAVMGQLYHVEKRIWLIEPDAMLVILVVVGALALVYFSG
jgi:cation:H+ antiporter